MCSEGCAGFMRQLGLPIVRAADFALREGRATWRELMLVGHLPDWGCLYLLVKGRLVDPSQAPLLLDLEYPEVNDLTTILWEAMGKEPLGTGKPPVLTPEQIIKEVFPNGLHL